VDGSQGDPNPREGATARAAGAIAVALVLAAGAPGARAQSGFVAIDFTTATASGNAMAGRTAGTFAISGRVRDAGRMTTAYRAVGTRVDATAMLIGTRGILTIALRGALGPILDGRQGVAGRWRVCGGTGPYLRLAGTGRWQAVTELGAAPAGMTAPTTRGAFLGRVSRGPRLGLPEADSAEAPRCSPPAPRWACCRMRASLGGRSGDGLGRRAGLQGDTAASR
jgi:hypothetical protein